MVEIDLIDARQPVQDANALNPDAPTQRYVVQPGASVQLIATASDEDTRQERSLEHEWSGPGVEASANNRDGTTSRATFTVPSTAVIGQSFTAEVAVTDPTGYIGQRPGDLHRGHQRAPRGHRPPQISPPKTALEAAPTAGAPFSSPAPAPIETAMPWPTAGSR